MPCGPRVFNWDPSLRYYEISRFSRNKNIAKSATSTSIDNVPVYYRTELVLVNETGPCLTFRSLLDFFATTLYCRTYTKGPNSPILGGAASQDPIFYGFKKHCMLLKQSLGQNQKWIRDISGAIEQFSW